MRVTGGGSSNIASASKSSPPFCVTRKPPSAHGVEPFAPPNVSAIFVVVPASTSTRCRAPSATSVTTSEPPDDPARDDPGSAHQTGPSRNVGSVVIRTGCTQRLLELDLHRVAVAPLAQHEIPALERRVVVHTEPHGRAVVAARRRELLHALERLAHSVTRQMI